MKFCTNFKDRLIGNMFRIKIIDMCFPNCNSVHTFFMRKTIDIYMLDQNYKILYVFKNVKPYRIIMPKKKVFYTVETSVNKYNYNKNEIFALKKESK